MTFLSLVVVLLGMSVVRAGNECQTPNNMTGSCIPLQQCPILFNKLSANISDADRALLRQSQCGFNGLHPNVCCPARESFPLSDLPVACGLHLEYRIYYGMKAFLDYYRWLALIQFSKNGQNRFLCSGSLINENYVLTAASCLTAENGWNATSVRLGEYDLRSEIDCDDDDCADPVVNVPIAETIVHENYKRDTKHDDIALIRLARSVTFNDWLNPICLPTEPSLRNKNYDHIRFSLTGFGRMENGTAYDVKRDLRPDGIGLGECNSAFASSTGNSIGSKQICVKNAGACINDAGAPLMILNDHDQTSPEMYIAGILSQETPNCGTPGHVVAFTRVDRYLDWILDRMRH